MESKMIFVFGSNTHGIHGAGAAHHAYKNCGARWGMGYGHYGDSFAIPTKGAIQIGDKWVVGNPLQIANIEAFVAGFISYAALHPELTFKVTRIGCGLAGFKDEEMAKLFQFHPSNCQFDEAWKPYLGEHATYWGTV